MKKNSQPKNKIIDLVNKNEFGFFLFLQDHLKQNINEINKCFKNYFHTFNLAYSIKANYHTNLIKIMNDSGLFFDVASEFELKKLLKIGIKTSSIWINTPYLNKGLIKLAIENKILVVVDSFQQLLDLKESAKSSSIKIGLRFNFSHYSSSRFGIEPNETSLREIVYFLRKNKTINLESISVHFSSYDRSSPFFLKRLEFLIHIYEKWFAEFNIKKFNIGGGFSGKMPVELEKQFSYKVPTWDDYAFEISKLKDKINALEIELIIEPGMALVSNVFKFAAEVISIKKINSVYYATLNSSIIFIKPTGHEKKLCFEILNPHKNLLESKDYVLCGISCMEKDILSTYKGYLQIGDIIIFENVGAYTMSFSPTFIFNNAKTYTI